MKSFIVYNTNFDITILIGSYDRVLEYVLDPENKVMEHYKCNLIGETGNIVLLATSDDMEDTKDRVYVFESSKQALQVMQRHVDWRFSRQDVVWLEPDTNTVFEAVAQPSASSEASGLSWQLEQAAMVKNFRTEAPKESQTQYAKSLNALDLSKVYNQTDISMIERGLKFFPLQDWKTIKSLMV
tara:strand:- start:55 stop:606 length:552 start_codon:yes stop_codon:yes gene_type:complete